MKDIAKRAGVSPITVSRVVTKTGYVGQETRLKVEAAIRELQYVPNQVASNLRSQQSDMLALVLPDITNSFWTTIARGVEDEAWARGYGVFICNTDDSPDKEERYIDTLLRRRVEGVLIVPTIASELQLKRLQGQGIKFVVLHRRLEEIQTDVVRCDGKQSVRELTSHLIRIGARRIAYIGGPLKDASNLDRLTGYKAALHAAGLIEEPGLIRLGVHGQDTGYRLVNELLDEHERPDALVIANSRLALGGLRAIRHAGLRIPADIAVAAFHDINAMDEYARRLITAVQPAYDMGQIGARRLLDKGNYGDASIQEIILQNRINLPAYALEQSLDAAPASMR